MSPWRWRWQTLCGWRRNSSPGTPEVWTPRPANVKDGSWTGSSSYGGSVLGIPQYSSSCLQNSEDLQELSASFPVLCAAKVVQRQSAHMCTANHASCFYVTTQQLNWGSGNNPNYWQLCSGLPSSQTYSRHFTESRKETTSWKETMSTTAKPQQPIIQESNETCFGIKEVREGSR